MEMKNSFEVLEEGCAEGFFLHSSDTIDLLSMRGEDDRFLAGEINDDDERWMEKIES